MKKKTKEVIIFKPKPDSPFGTPGGWQKLIRKSSILKKIVKKLKK